MKNHPLMAFAIAAVLSLIAETSFACDHCGGHRHQTRVTTTTTNSIRITYGTSYVVSRPLPVGCYVTRVVAHSTPAHGHIVRTSHSGHAAEVRLADGNCAWVCNPSCNTFAETTCVVYRYDVYLSDGRYLPCGVLNVGGTWIAAIDPPTSAVDWSK